MEQVTVNVKDLKEAAEAIKGHDRALRNVLDSIKDVDDQLGVVAENQSRFAEGVREVIRTQTKMVNAQEEVSGTLEEIALLADEKVPDALGNLNQKIEQARDGVERSTSQLYETLSEAERVTAKTSAESIEQAVERMKQAIRSEVAQMEDDVQESSETARQTINGVADSVIVPLIETLKAHESKVTRTEKTMVELSEVLTTSSQNIAEQIDELDEQMNEFREEVREAQAFLETSIEKKKEELEEERNAFRSTLSRVRELFGS